MRQILFNDFTLPYQLVVIAGYPDFCNVFFSDVYASGKKSLQRNGGVLIIVITHSVKVEKALAAGQFFSPISVIPFKFQIFAGNKLVQSVRAAA